MNSVGYERCWLDVRSQGKACKEQHLQQHVVYICSQNVTHTTGTTFSTIWRPELNRDFWKFTQISQVRLKNWVSRQKKPHSILMITAIHGFTFCL